MRSSECYTSARTRAGWHSLRLKQHSVFCLEPPGAAACRKSMVDSLLSGCIPVFFLSADQYANLWPLHFGAWRESASVNIDPQVAA